MNAIHTVWTTPKSEFEDFEVLTMILSALKWREKNGKIGLVTDTKGADFFKKNKLDCLWDNGIEILLDDLSVNPQMFWAAGKIYALQKQNTPIAVIDTDFIVWEKLDFSNISDAAVIHFEDINESVYPNPDKFKMKQNYEYKNFNLNVKACNTAFYVIKNTEFKDFYTQEAISFMENSENTDEPLIYMTYAEQRLFGMVADYMDIKIQELCKLNVLFDKQNKLFTHIWGMKQQMRDNEELRVAFCHKCAERINADFPEITGILNEVNLLKKYF